MKQNIDKKKLRTKELEEFVKKQEQIDSKSNRDNIIIWSCLLLGFAGLFIVLKSNDLFPNTKKERIADSSTMDKSRIAKAEVASIPILTEQKNSTMVSIKGIKEAAEVITFKVDGFQKNANYKIEFGDGVSRVLTSPIAKHAYREPGNYNVQLLVSYKNETRVQYENTISIADRIEVADGALSEMRD